MDSREAKRRIGLLTAAIEGLEKGRAFSPEETALLHTLACRERAKLGKELVVEGVEKV